MTLAFDSLNGGGWQAQVFVANLPLKKLPTNMHRGDIVCDTIPPGQ